MIKLVNKATKSLNHLVFLNVLFGFAKCYADINLILLPPLSLLAEQTCGWQICLIQKLLALTSFPAQLCFITPSSGKRAAYWVLDSTFMNEE